MQINLFNKKVNLVVLILVVHLTFSYYYIPKYWSAAAGFAIILLLSIVLWKKSFRYWSGFQLKSREIIFSLVLTAIFLAGSLFLLKTIAHTNDIQFQLGNYKSFTHTFFYTLNEEIVMGALLLKGIKSHWKKLTNWKISIVVAFCFTFIHFVFFKWIFLNSGNLSIITLLSLFSVGILRNNLILKTGHIGYSWAIHFGWIFPMLGCLHYNKTDEFFLTDFERFNLYLGDYKTFLVVVILAIISFFWLSKKITFS